MSNCVSLKSFHVVCWGRDGISAVDPNENHYNCCHQMSDFKAKMHLNRFRLGLHLRPHWGSLQRSPKLPSWNKEDLYTSKERGAEVGKGEAR